MDYGDVVVMVLDILLLLEVYIMAKRDCKRKEVKPSNGGSVMVKSDKKSKQEVKKHDPVGKS